MVKKSGIAPLIRSVAIPDPGLRINGLEGLFTVLVRCSGALTIENETCSLIRATIKAKT